MSIKHAILGLLHARDMHGYRIKKTLETDFAHMWTLNYGQIYQTLARLRDDGMLSMVEQAADEGPPRKLYSITARGRDEFGDWLTSTEERKPLMRDPFLIRFAFAGIQGHEQALVMIDAQIQEYEKQRDGRLEELPRRSRGSIYGRLLADLGLSSNEAMLEWLKRARVQIASERTLQAPPAEAGEADSPGDRP